MQCEYSGKPLALCNVLSLPKPGTETKSHYRLPNSPGW